MTLDFGIKVSKAGKDITSANIEDMIFTSSSPVTATAMIVKQGSGNATVSASSSLDVSVTHSFGYIPTVILYTEPTPGSGRWFMGCAYTNGVENTYINPDGTYTYVDSTYFKFRITNPVASEKVVKYYYFILGESGI